MCKPAIIGVAGNSWTVPVFVLTTQNNELVPGDEDPIPGDGIRHHLLGNQEDHPNEFFDNV